MANKIAGIILAAGLSSRMGTPKMLLKWGSSTVLGQVISTFQQVGVDQIVVITGAERKLIEAEAMNCSSGFPLECVFNPQFESGDMLSSLQCGLNVLGEEITSALIGLGDQPQLSLEAVSSVLEMTEISEGKLIVPSHDGHRGHPLLVHRNFWKNILTLSPPATLRDFLNQKKDLIHYVETDQTILKDLDTPQDYSRDRP